MKNPAVVLVSILMILLASACASTTNTDDLIGIWTQGGHLTQFNEDGTFTFANSVDDLRSRPI